MPSRQRGEDSRLITPQDAGSAKAIIGAGAKAIATSSWSVAAALGYKDGEDLPLSLAEHVVRGIATTVNVPVTVDFEGGYSDDDQKLASNITKLLEIGVIGINFQDRYGQGPGLYGIDRQAKSALLRSAGQPSSRASPSSSMLGGLTCFSATAVTSRRHCEGRMRTLQLRRQLFHHRSDRSSSGPADRRGSDAAVNVMVMDGVPSNDKLAKLKSLSRELQE